MPATTVSSFARNFGCQRALSLFKLADPPFVMSLLSASSHLKKRSLLVSLVLISLFAHERLSAQCTIDNLSFTPNANHDGVVVHGVTTGCNSVTVRFTNPQLPDKSQAVTPGSPFGVEFGPADGVTSTMLQNNFVCGSRNFKGIIFCTNDPNCGHTLDGQFDCTDFCPPSISLSVHTTNGDPVDPTPCLEPGDYVVKVNEQVPVSSDPDWDWFVNNAYETSVVNPADGFPVSVANGETKTVSLNGRVGQCHLNAAIVLQGCSGSPAGGGTPSPTAAQPPTTTQTPPGNETPPVTETTPPPGTPPVENQAGLDFCFVWMIINVILVIITLILIVVAFCAPHPATISLAVAAGIITLGSIILWLILCSNWILVDQHFCDLLKLFMVILGWIVAVVGVALVAALIALAAGQAEVACAIFGLLTDLGFLGTILAICTLLNFYIFHCPLS